LERKTVLYKIISIVSIIIRQFYLPNPFEPLGVIVLTPYFVLTPFMLNLLAGIVLGPITYEIVGICYNGEFPAWGSGLYLFFYCVHTGVVYLIVRLYLLTGILWLSILLILLAYFSVLVLFNRLVFRAEEI